MTTIYELINAALRASNSTLEVSAADAQASNSAAMPERQLHLFQPPRPLALRLGDEFFSAAPREPGVYIMTGADGRVLYIGQSKNLRARLGSYKNARRDRTPRKVLRLVHEVRSITWEKCESAEAAISRESELLGVHRPRFNRANVYPMHTWIWLRSDEQALTIGRTNWEAGVAVAPTPEEFEGPPGETKLFGPFKTSASVAYAALLRLIWVVANQTGRLEDFPSRLLSEKPPRTLTLRWREAGLREHLLAGITDLLAGISDSVLTFLRERLPPDETLSPFQRALHQHDLEVLAQFHTVLTRGLH